MSARDELIEIVTRDPKSSGGDRVWATDLVDALVAEVREQDAANNELLHHIRQAAHWGDIAEIRRLIADHDAVKRQASLLNAVRAGGPTIRWKPGLAITQLREAGWHPVSPATASRDLAALADAGHLLPHDEDGFRWYEPTGEVTR